MKTSIKWLKEYVSIPWSDSKLAEELTLAGLEVEEIMKVHDFQDSIVIAEILSRKPHPNADKLSLCMVDDSRGEPLQIVCGAANCNAGEKVVLAKIGTNFPGIGKIKKCKIRGEQSSGMLCSQSELELGDDHSGIYLLPQDAPLGLSLAEFLGVDTVIDWEVTPNRPDWLSHLGIAREIAAISNSPLRPPKVEFAGSSNDAVNDCATIEVLNTDLCPRYTARVIKDVKIKPSPDWIQKALRSVGLRPINNVVDITNFVLLECGQPLHAFDLAKLSGRKIIVREAHDGEVFQALDGSSHKLSRDHLVIADAKGAVALAGIIGGENSQIESKTSDVLLESAAFYPPNVRSSSKDLGISTDSSYRFSRGVDIEMVEFASARAAQLICEHANGTLAAGVIDICRKSKGPNRISCRFERVNRLLGLSIGTDEIKSIFTKLKLQIVENDEERCVVEVPSFRLDLSREVDLIEEVVRLYGLDRVPAEVGIFSLGGGMDEDALYPIQRLRSRMLALGLDECITNSFVGNNFHEGEGTASPRCSIPLKNPLSTELSLLRSNLLPNMIATVATNSVRWNDHLRLFEIGRIFVRENQKNSEGMELGIALSGRRYNDHYSNEGAATYDFFDLRGMVEEILEAEGVPNFVFQRGQCFGFKEGCCVQVMAGESYLGVIGEVSEEQLKDFRIKYPVYIATIDIDKLFQCVRRETMFKPLPQFPQVTRDVVFSADENLEHQQVVETVMEVGVKFLESVEVVEIYRNEKTLGKGKKSLAYTLTFRSPTRTLTDEEVNQAQEKIRQALLKQLPITIR